MIIDCAVYTDGKRRGGTLPLADALEASKEPESFVWIGLHEDETTLNAFDASAGPNEVTAPVTSAVAAARRV